VYVAAWLAAAPCRQAFKLLNCLLRHYIRVVHVMALMLWLDGMMMMVVVSYMSVCMHDGMVMGYSTG
jgi:hypothetical protein